MKYRILAAVFVVAAGVGSAMAQSITATKAYVDRKYNDATNAVPGIVTNEVTELSAWTFTCDVPEIQAALDANPPGVDDGASFDAGAGRWEYWWNMKDPYPPAQIGDWTFTKPYHFTESPNELSISWYSAYENSAGEVAEVTATRRWITRNALGLARLKDIEPLPNYEAVTNTARDVVNSVWDAKLGVAWEARMHDGHLYYIAVTNVQEVAR